jgi:hypothetical protein
MDIEEASYVRFLTVNILTEASRQVTDGFIVQRVKSPQSAPVLNHLLP